MGTEIGASNSATACRVMWTVICTRTGLDDQSGLKMHIRPISGMLEIRILRPAYSVRLAAIPYQANRTDEMVQLDGTGK